MAYDPAPTEAAINAYGVKNLYANIAQQEQAAAPPAAQMQVDEYGNPQGGSISYNDGSNGTSQLYGNPKEYQVPGIPGYVMQDGSGNLTVVAPGSGSTPTRVGTNGDLWSKGNDSHGWLDKHFYGIVGAAIAAMGGAAVAGEMAGGGAAAGAATDAGAAAGTTAGASTAATALPAGGMAATGASSADLAGLGSGFSAAGDASALSPELLGTGYAGSMAAAEPLGYTLGGSVMAGAPGTLSNASGLGSATTNFANTGAGGLNPDYSNEGNNYPTSDSTQGAGGSPVNASTSSSLSGSPALSAAQQKLATALMKMATGGGGASGAGAGYGGTGGGQNGLPNELLNETPGMAATSAPQQAQQQAVAQALMLGNPSQPQFNAVSYGSSPTASPQLIKALQGNMYG